MIGDCPHTHEPVPHTADFDESGGAVQSCSICGGLIRQCSNCDTLNRQAASFCRRCGQGLAQPPSDQQRLVTPGELERRLSTAEQTPLELVFQIPEASVLVHWLLSADGLFLFVEQPYLAQVNVYRAPITDFPVPEGDLLNISYPLPATDRWVDEPLVTKHGLFLAAADALHFFPAHGDANYLAQRVWSVPVGHRLEALCPCDNGRCALFIVNAETSGPTSALLLYQGNTQTREWQLALELDLPAAQGYGYVSGPARGACEADIWVYNGTEIIFIALNRTPVVKRRFPVVQGQEPQQSFKGRARGGFFQPFVMTNATKAGQFVYPGKPRNGGQASIAVLDLTTGGERNWGELRIGDWLRPDPWGEGILMRHGKQLEHVVSGTITWSRAGDFTDMPPTLAQTWMAAVKAGSIGTPGSYDSILQLNLFEFVRKAEGIAVESLVTYPTGYRSIPGLAPLTTDGWLVYAGSNNATDEPTIAVARLVE